MDGRGGLIDPGDAMKVVNVHQRLLHASPEKAGALIDSLASPLDALWPRRKWPGIALDAPLGPGACGGHGPIRYFVEHHVPGESVRFRFTAPRGFCGWHAFEVLDATAAHCVLEHRIEMTTRGLAVWSWPLLYRPLHDALIEDALSVAQASLGEEPRPVSWSAWVRFLRWLMNPTGKRRPGPPVRDGSHAG
jgi:hypothetical protein